VGGGGEGGGGGECCEFRRPAARREGRLECGEQGRRPCRRRAWVIAQGRGGAGRSGGGACEGPAHQGQVVDRAHNGGGEPQQHQRAHAVQHHASLVLHLLPLLSGLRGAAGQRGGGGEAEGEEGHGGLATGEGGQRRRARGAGGGGAPGRGAPSAKGWPARRGAAPPGTRSTAPGIARRPRPPPRRSGARPRPPRRRARDLPPPRGQDARDRAPGRLAAPRRAGGRCWRAAAAATPLRNPTPRRGGAPNCSPSRSGPRQSSPRPPGSRARREPPPRDGQPVCGGNGATRPSARTPRAARDGVIPSQGLTWPTRAGRRATEAARRGAAARTADRFRDALSCMIAAAVWWWVRSGHGAGATGVQARAAGRGLGRRRAGRRRAGRPSSFGARRYFRPAGRPAPSHWGRAPAPLAPRRAQGRPAAAAGRSRRHAPRPQHFESGLKSRSPPGTTLAAAAPTPACAAPCHTHG
jgi:hypothetical protein